MNRPTTINFQATTAGTEAATTLIDALLLTICDATNTNAHTSTYNKNSNTHTHQFNDSTTVTHVERPRLAGLLTTITATIHAPANAAGPIARALLVEGGHMPALKRPTVTIN